MTFCYTKADGYTEEFTCRRFHDIFGRKFHTWGVGLTFEFQKRFINPPDSTTKYAS